MLASIHLIVGASIGKYTNYWPLAFVLAVLSHFALDRLPHTDPGSLKGAEERGTMVLQDFLLAWLDVAIAFGALLWISQTADFSASVLAGAFGAIVPDFATPGFTIIPWLKSFWLTKWYYRWHRNIQRTVDKKSWLKGLAIELFVLFAAILLYLL